MWHCPPPGTNLICYPNCLSGRWHKNGVFCCIIPLQVIEQWRWHPVLLLQLLPGHAALKLFYRHTMAFSQSYLQLGYIFMRFHSLVTFNRVAIGGTFHREKESSHPPLYPPRNITSRFCETWLYNTKEFSRWKGKRPAYIWRASNNIPVFRHHSAIRQRNT